MTFWRCTLQLQKKGNSANQIAKQQLAIISLFFCSSICKFPNHITFLMGTLCHLSLYFLCIFILSQLTLTCSILNLIKAVPVHVSISKYKRSLQKESISVFRPSNYQLFSLSITSKQVIKNKTLGGCFEKSNHNPTSLGLPSNSVADTIYINNSNENLDENFTTQDLQLRLLEIISQIQEKIKTSRAKPKGNNCFCSKQFLQQKH